MDIHDSNHEIAQLQQKEKEQ